ncbi:hypothetical protein H6P81_003974 [Aristolochia fimbriata]|uniref:Uncharacterized protein n=1 Tax=Aristolochia fimbriata TaxID=158543 RepID=A0AAV7FHD1_ARIFI|nr:hypothetical protein H6P81_003974 [Aristolochia fimbriata]
MAKLGSSNISCFLLLCCLLVSYFALHECATASGGAEAAEGTGFCVETSDHKWACMLASPEYIFDTLEDCLKNCILPP